ncbi:hypothetical protein EAF04_006642 [Stromatinia cepivora]|nr:hypothetical protein EAF04_006642 [Stromatinia cepivora]
MIDRTRKFDPHPSAQLCNSYKIMQFTTGELMIIQFDGYKISIFLKELKVAYGKTYTWQNINIFQNRQKDPWYTAINPNGRIPVIVNHDRSDFVVWESSAILAYLTRYYDPSHHFSFPIDSDDYSHCEQWIAFHHAGIGPMQNLLADYNFQGEKKKA